MTIWRRQAPRPKADDIYQLVIIPVAKEPREVVEPGIKSLAAGTFPPERIIVVLALEERAQEDIKKDAEELLEAYKEAFGDMMIVVHPDGIPGEAGWCGRATARPRRG